MSDGDLEFPSAPLSPSLPSDFLEPPPSTAIATGLAKSKNANGHSGHSDLNNSNGFSNSHSSNGSNGSNGSHSTNSSPTKGESRIKELRSRMNKWITEARNKKHDSDRASSERNHRLATALALDALVCFMIGFEYEDRCEAARHQAQASRGNNGSTHSGGVNKNGSGGTGSGPIPAVPSAAAPNSKQVVLGRSWLSLVPFLAKLASSAKSVDADVAGVCYQVLAVVRLHVANYERRSDGTPEECAKLLYSALANFSTGLRLLPLTTVRERFGLTVKGGWSSTKLNPLQPDPLHDRAALPLHVNSTLGECAAFALRIGMKWAEMEGIAYEWEAAKA